MHGWDLSSRAVPLTEGYRARQLQSLSCTLRASAPGHPNTKGPRSSHPQAESIAMMSKLDDHFLYTLQDVPYGERTPTAKLPQMAAENSSIEMKEAITSLSPRPRQPRTKEDTLIELCNGCFSDRNTQAHSFRLHQGSRPRGFAQADWGDCRRTGSPTGRGPGSKGRPPVVKVRPILARRLHRSSASDPAAC